MSTPSRCPGCKGKLSKEESGEHVLYGCDDCGGIFAKPDTAALVVKGMGNLMKPAVDAIEQFAPMKRRRKPGGEDPVPRDCPMCRLPMKMADAAGVDIDVCESHGTWFDRGEIALIAQHLGKEDVAPPPESSAFDRVDGADVAVAGVEVGFHLLFALLDAASDD